jgi:inhibitor of cysteine peptidase
LLLYIITASLILAACGGQGARTVQVREQDAGRTVALSRGDRLAVVLEGNPTTGYTWEQSAGDASILKPAGEPTFTPASQGIGAGGEVSIPFLAAGDAKLMRIALIYHRAFEPNVPPLKTFTVEIAVS